MTGISLVRGLTACAQHTALDARPLLYAVALLSSGCGGSSSLPPSPPPPPLAAPAIAAQPVDQSVPMGLMATYSVTATGASLQYQWAKDGAKIPGAADSTYVTPPVQFADTGRPSRSR
jgi:hypothetical protein